MGEVLEDLRELTVHYAVSGYPNAANALPCELTRRVGPGSLPRGLGGSLVELGVLTELGWELVGVYIVGSRAR